MSAAREKIPANALNIFIAYVQENKAEYEKIEKHLAVLLRQELIVIWTQQKISAGKRLVSELYNALDAAQIILLLISSDFIASEQGDSLLTRAMARAETGHVRVIPILLNLPAGWELLPCAELQPLPSNRKPITEWKSRDAALADVGTGIYAIVREMLNKQNGTRAIQHNSIVLSPPSCSPGTYLQRVDLVEKIYHQLVLSEVNALVLTGMGGLGKSTLAALLYQYTEQQRLAGPGPFTQKTLWLQIQASTTIVDLIDVLRHVEGQTPPDVGKFAAQDMAGELFKLLNPSNGPYLIVLDQFEEWLDPQTQQALEERPGIGEWLALLNEHPCTCRVVLTSRFTPRGKRHSSSLYLQAYYVPELTIEEGSALLRMRGMQAKETELRQVVERCQGHALALVLLDGLLHSDQSARIADFFNNAWFEHERIEIMAHELLNYIFTHQLDQDQRDLLLAFAVYREPVPLEAAQAIVEKRGMLTTPRLMNARRVLLSQHLLQASGHLHYRLHALVAEFAREHFESYQALQQAHAYAAQYYQQLYNQQQATLTYGSRKQHRRIEDRHDLVEALWHYCHARRQQQAYDLILQENIFFDLMRWGGNSTLLELYRDLLPSQDWQPAPEQTARIYNEIGEIYQVLGQREQTWQYFEEALQCYRTLNHKGIDVSGGIINALNNQGAIYRRQGELEEALRCYQEAKHIAERAEEALAGRGTTLNNIGYAYYTLGQRARNQEQAKQYYELALQHYLQALPLHKAVGSQGEEARTLTNLGEVHFALGHCEEAYDYTQQALSLAQEQGDRWVEATALHDLGTLSSTFEHENAFEAALEYYGQAYHIFREIDAREDAITVLKNIGYLHLFQKKEPKRYEVILACFLQAGEIANQVQETAPDAIPRGVMLELELALSKQRLQALREEVEGRREQIIEQALQA